MPVKVAEAKYPVIDTDPHAGRVIRYMRPSDYAVLAGGTAAAPALLYAMGVSFFPARIMHLHEINILSQNELTLQEGTSGPQ